MWSVCEAGGWQDRLTCPEWWIDDGNAVCLGFGGFFLVNNHPAKHSAWQ
jgi:hypothetical protein